MPPEPLKKIHFACIEYSTKSGWIWKPSPDRPNYLCNPEKEIDPTSFGCWTSALNGEHIPLSFLRIAKKTHSLSYKIQRAFDRIQEKGSKTPIYHNLNYIKKFNLVLILIHRYSMALMGDLISRLQKIHPHAVYLGSINSPLGLLRETWKKSAEYIAFKKFADRCDIFVNVNRAAQSYLEYITTSRVLYLPQFYPFKFAQKFYQPASKREKTILVAGDMTRTDNLAGQLVAIQIQKKHPEFLIKIVKMQGLNLKPLQMAKARFKIIPFVPWQKNLKRIASFSFVINMDQIWTLGRLQSDCAAVGTPSIGLNANNQIEFFPRLATADIKEIDRAVALAERLIADPDFFRKVQEEAQQKIAQNSYLQSIERLYVMLKNLPKKIDHALPGH